jgi:hypothetical protein
MPDGDSADAFDFSMPAEVYMGRGMRHRPGLRFKGFDSAAEAIRFVMERPRPAGEVVTIECDDARFGLAEIAALYNDTRYPLPRLASPVAEVPVRRVNIAVPVTRGAARTRQVEPREAPLPYSRPEADPASARPRHRYGVGARLRMNNGGNSLARQASYCRVMFILPYEGGQLLYRVKSELESFERVVAEVDLAPA